MRRITSIFLSLMCLTGMPLHSYDNLAEVPLTTENLYLQMEVLSWSPRIFIFRNFLSEEECDHLIEKARPSLKRSTVIDPDGTSGKLDKGRTSSGTFLPKHHNDYIIEEIERRIAMVTMNPPDCAECIQVVHYEVGEEYRPHYDYFIPSQKGSLVFLLNGGQRISSFLMYLNTPEEGGETIFPKAGVKVSPVKGDALFFYDMTPDGKVDPLSFHGGAPVLKGEKWLATKWQRQQIVK